MQRGIALAATLVLWILITEIGQAAVPGLASAFRGENADDPDRPVLAAREDLLVLHVLELIGQESAMGAPLSRSCTACLKPTTSARALKARPSGVWRAAPSRSVAKSCVLASLR
jgi:hypothetical protein